MVASLPGSGPIREITEVSYATLAEIIIVVTTARWLSRPCLIYLPATWSPTADQLRAVIGTILADLDAPPSVTVIDTGGPNVADLFRDAADEHADHLAAPL